MANNNFVVKNGLTVNGSFTANSTAVNTAAITATSVNATSVNTATANVTTSLVIGSNVNFNTTTLFVGNNSVNTSVTGGQISISGATVNSTIYQGTANNANNLNGQPASFYANATNLTTGTLADARLAGTYNNITANNASFLGGSSAASYATLSGATFSGAINSGANVTVNTTSFYVGNATVNTSITGGSIVINGGLFRANSTVVNAAAINVQSINSLTINSVSVNTATANATSSLVVGANVTLNTTSLFVGNATVNTSITGGQISLSGVTVNSTIYSGTASNANNANNLNGQAASFYTNIPARLGYSPVNKTGDGMTGDLTVTRTDTGFASRGAIFLGNSGVRFIYYNGTNYEIPGGKVIASNFMVDTNQNYYMTSDEAVYMRWDGSYIAFSHRFYTPGTINAGGTIATSGRVYCKSPDNVADGYAMINSQGRFRDWIWDDAGGFVSFAIDGNPKGITVFDSDISLKKDIEPTTYDATKTINDIEFVSYNWKPTEYTDADGTVHVTDKGHVKCGFIAQQLQTADSGLVKALPDGKLMPDILNLISVMGLALQTAQKKIDTLESRLAALESKVG